MRTIYLNIFLFFIRVLNNLGWNVELVFVDNFMQSLMVVHNL